MARRTITGPPALVAGPYKPPAVKVGDGLYDEVAHERRYVTGFNNAPIRWPVTVHDSNDATVHIVAGDLVRALYTESNIAVQYWFGATESMVTRWRRALNVPRHNKGTAAVYRERYADKSAALVEGLRSAGPISRHALIEPGTIRALRQRLGLTQRELADKLWISVATVLAWEDGRRAPGGPERKLLGLLADGII